MQTISFYLNYVQIVVQEVLTAVTMKSYVFWDITPCSPAKIIRDFGGIYGLHLQDRRVSQARIEEGVGSKLPGFLLGSLG
jgi:hypothetical protein